MRKIRFTFEKQKFGKAVQLLTAVMIGKLTTALREWFAMNQQQVAMAQSIPDRNPETHTHHMFTNHLPSWKIHTPGRAGMLKCPDQHTPINTDGQHGFFSRVLGPFWKPNDFSFLDCCGCKDHLLPYWHEIKYPK